MHSFYGFSVGTGPVTVRRIAGLTVIRGRFRHAVPDRYLPSRAGLKTRYDLIVAENERADAERLVGAPSVGILLELVRQGSPFAFRALNTAVASFSLAWRCSRSGLTS